MLFFGFVFLLDSDKEGEDEGIEEEFLVLFVFVKNIKKVLVLVFSFVLF